MTGCATGWTAASGCANDWHPEPETWVIVIVSLLLLFLMVLLVGVPAFVYLKKPAAVGLASLLPPVLFQGGNWLYLGYVDPFWPIALVVSSAIALVAALGVGWIVDRFVVQS